MREASKSQDHDVLTSPKGIGWTAVLGTKALLTMCRTALAGRIKAGWTKETVTTTDAEMAGTAVWAAGEYGLVGSGEQAGKQSGGHFGWVLVRDGDAWRAAMLTANVTPPKQ